MQLDKIQSDLKIAQLAKDELKTSTLRLLLAEIHNQEIQNRAPLDEEGIVSVIQREVKKRKEAANGFRAGGRDEQAIREDEEAKILQEYLPAQISDEELTNLVSGTITELGATSLADMGKVIGVVMDKVAGKADGGRVSALVKEKLNI